MLLLYSCQTQTYQKNNCIIEDYHPKKSLDFNPKLTTVLVGGCFDILHHGHIEFLRKAKESGDFLIVALEPDSKIMCLKKRLPFHNEKERAYNIASIKYVDKVLILHYLNGFEDYSQLVLDIKPKILAITFNDPCFEKKQIQVKNINAKLKIVTDPVKDFSTSKIYNESLNRSLVFKGQVIYGKQIGRTIGYPTANIIIDPKNIKDGVYSSNVLIGKTLYNGMSYFDKKRDNILETYVFDYKNDLYGQEIIVALKTFIRKPKYNLTMSMLNELIKQDELLCIKDLQ